MTKPFSGAWTAQPDNFKQHGPITAEIVNITSQWANVEMFLGMIMSEILGEEPLTGIAMYYSVKTDGSKTDLMKAAAKEKLNEEMQKRLTTLLKNIERAKQYRNLVAHGLWGISDETPESLILIGKTEFVKMMSLSRIKVKPEDGMRGRFIQIMEEHSNASIEYTMDDFKQMSAEIAKASGLVGDFLTELRRPALEEMMKENEKMFGKLIGDQNGVGAL